MRIPRRFKAWAAAISLLLLVSVGFLFFIALKPSPITWENCQRLKIGMSKPEVIAILGKPDTDMWRRFTTVKECREVWSEGRHPMSTPAGAMIDVDFDEEDRVVNFGWFLPTGPEPGFLERLINWFN
ncbi:MAG TPA: hypothetical protein VKE98_13355 [Gemmataceae bacterium]|nr:hypothetical protein [Gemmataceae bacterium]